VCIPQPVLELVQRRRVLEPPGARVMGSPVAVARDPAQLKSQQPAVVDVRLIPLPAQWVLAGPDGVGNRLQTGL